MKWIARHIADSVYAEIYTDVYTTVGADESITQYRLDVWKNGKGIADDMQDTLQFAMQTALELYNIPLDAWQQVED